MLGAVEGLKVQTQILEPGAIFLVVTGGEALYADMGHFGARPIRVAWFAIVLPALLLNFKLPPERVVELGVQVEM